MKLIFTSIFLLSLNSFYGQSNLPTDGGSVACSTTTGALASVSDAFGITMVAKTYPSVACMSVPLSTISGENQFCKDNSQVPSASSVYPYTVLMRTCWNASCQNQTRNYVYDFSTVAKRPINLTFRLSDIDNNFDSTTVLVYSGGSLVSYTYTLGSYARVYAAAPSYVFNGAGGSPNASANTNYLNGVVDINCGASKYVDSIVVKRHAVTNGNYFSSCPSSSIGDFKWQSVVPIYIKQIYLSSGNLKKINWETANNSAISSFNIEASQDGLRFNSIGELIADNNSNSSVYSFIDNAGFAYYRIKVNLRSGGFIYSTIINAANINIRPPVLYAV